MLAQAGASGGTRRWGSATPHVAAAAVQESARNACTVAGLINQTGGLPGDTANQTENQGMAHIF